MKFLSPSRVLRLWVAVLALGISCELVIGVSDLNNGRCPSGQKACDDNRCVPKSDPTTSCALLTCAPCVLSHATATCGYNGECVVSVCNGDYRDCDSAQPGCETDVAHDPNHCGSCTAPACVTANGFPGCSAKVCATGGCRPGYDDCNGDPTDGCEADLQASPKHCGACFQPCGAGSSCQQGSCR